jgi:hypothetical protein
MPELTAHIVGIDHPLGVYCASELIRKGFLVSGTSTALKPTNQARMALKQLQIPSYKKIQCETVCGSQDYVIFIDTSVKQLESLGHALKSGSKNLSWYKCLFILTKQVTESEFNSWVNQVNNLIRYKKVQKLILYAPYLFGEGIGPKTNIGLSFWIDRLSQKKFVLPQQQTAMLEPLYIKNAASELIELFLLPARHQSPLVLSGPQTLPAINWGFILQTQAGANKLGKFQLISNKRQQMYDWHQRHKRVYPRQSDLVEEAVSKWLVWLKKPYSLMIDTPLPAAKKTAKKNTARKTGSAKTFTGIGVALITLGILGGLFTLLISPTTLQLSSQTNVANQTLEENVIDSILSLAKNGIGPGISNNLEMDVIKSHFENSQQALLKHKQEQSYVKDMNMLVYTELTSMIAQVSHPQGGSVAIVIYNSNVRNGVGGEIQAVTVIDIAGGRISSAKTYPVAELNQKLEGVVIPPTDLSKLKGVENWLMQDAMWAPDITAVGATIAWFLEKQTGVKPVAVIGLPEAHLNELLIELNNGVHTGSQASITEKLSLIAAHLQSNETATGKQLLQKTLHSLKHNRGFVIGGPWVNGLATILHPAMCIRRIDHPNCVADYLMVNIAHLNPLDGNQVLLLKEKHQMTVAAESIHHQHEVLLGNPSPASMEMVIRLYLPSSATALETTHDNFSVPLEVGNESIGEYLLTMKVMPETQSRINLIYKVPKQTLHQWQYLNQVGLGQRPLTLEISQAGTVKQSWSLEVDQEIVVSVNP